MSTLSSKIFKISNLNPKTKNMKLVPLYINPSHLDNSYTLIMNSSLQNFDQKEKIQHSLVNIGCKKTKFKKSLRNTMNNSTKNVKKDNHLNFFTNYKNENAQNTNKNKYNNNPKNISKINSKKNNKRNKDNIILLSNLSKDNNKYTKTLKLQRNNNESQRKIKIIGVKKKETAKNVIKDKNLHSDKKNGTLFKKSFLTINNIIVSRNSKLSTFGKLSYRNINNQYTTNSIRKDINNPDIKDSLSNKQIYYTNKISYTNSLDNTINNNTINYQNKMKDSLGVINIKKTYFKNKKNQYKFFKNYRVLVNLLLKMKKNCKNNKFELNSLMDEKQQIKELNKIPHSKSIKNNKIKLDESLNINSLYNNRIKSKEIYNKYGFRRIIINKSNILKYIQKNSKSTKNINLNKKNSDKKNKININDINKANNNKNNGKKEHNYSKINIGKKDCFFERIKPNMKLYKEKNDRKTKINAIKINEFKVKKQKEKNIKNSLLKSRCGDEELTEGINKSKIVIGDIESYNDIIENDKLNNDFYQGDRPINVETYNTFDKNCFSKNIDKNNSINDNLMDKNENTEIYEKNNNIDDSKIYISNDEINPNDRDIKLLMNNVEDGNDITDYSTQFLKRNIRDRNNNILPYHVLKISYEKKYNNKTKNYSIIEKMNNDNIFLNDNNLSFFNCAKNSRSNNVIDKLIIYEGKKWNEIVKNDTLFTKNCNNQKKNVIQNSNNLFIEGKNQNCFIF